MKVTGRTLAPPHLSGPIRISVIILCIAINILDGFDILAMSYSAPAIAREWMLAPNQVGLIFSAALSGMMVGALGLAALADIRGRRAVILLCLGVSAIGMLATGMSGGLNQMLFARFLTGVGVGGLMPTLNTMAAESAGHRYRNLAVVLQATGYPLGGVIGGLIAMETIGGFGWQPLMLGGAGLALALLLAAYIWMPESASYLNAKNLEPAAECEDQGQLVLSKPDRGALEADYLKVRSTGILSLFSERLRARLGLLSLSTFFVQFSFYFFLSWTPTILVQTGLSTRIGIAGGIWMSIGGIAADLIFALAAMRWRSTALGVLSMAGAFASVIFLAFALSSGSILFLSALGLGGFLFASMAGIYAVAPTVFPPSSRAAGTGVVISIGRLGGVVGPIAGAALLADGRLSTPTCLTLMATPLLFGAVLMALLPKRDQEPRGI